MTTRQQKTISKSKFIRRRESAILRAKQRRITQLAAVFVALLVLGVMAFTFWPKDQTKESEVEISLDKSLGEENAPVVVMEYGDFQCPACQFFFETTVSQLKTEYVQTGKVRFVFRQFAFLGDESQWAAEASECANEQERFWDYYDKLYQEQNGENVGVYSKDNLKRFAADLKLDTAEFNQCLDSGRYTEKVQQETLEGRQAGVRGTPAVFVNGRYIDNGNSYPALQAAVDAALGE